MHFRLISSYHGLRGFDACEWAHKRQAQLTINRIRSKPACDDLKHGCTDTGLLPGTDLQDQRCRLFGILAHHASQSGIGRQSLSSDFGHIA